MPEKLPKTQKIVEKKLVYDIGPDGQANWTGEVEQRENKLIVKSRKEPESDSDKLAEIRRKLREQSK